MAAISTRTTRARTRLLVAGAILILSLGGLACSSDGDEGDEPQTIRSQAEAMVAGSLADRAGLGELRPTCDDVVEPTVGTTFTCTAVTDNQFTVWVDGLIDAEGRLDLRTTNVITAAALPSFERAAVLALNQSVGTGLGVDAVDCGESSIVVGPDQNMVCSVTDPNTREVFDLTMTLVDLEARTFNLVVAAEPRP